MSTPEFPIARDIAGNAFLARQAGLSVTCDLNRRRLTLARHGVPIPVGDDDTHAIIHMVRALRELLPGAAADDVLLYVCAEHLRQRAGGPDGGR